MGFFLKQAYLVLVIFVPLSHSDTKIWLPNSDISHPKNWQKKIENHQECGGLIFAKINTATVFIKSLRVKELVLPLYGALEFQDDNSYIQVDPSSSDFLNCIQLKSVNQSAWCDFDNWKSKENPDNPAIPHSQRLPCSNDEVVFPHGINTSVYYDQYLTFRGEIFKFGDDFYESSQFESFLESSVGREVFKFPRHTLIDDPLVECSIPSRQACEAAKNSDLKCLNPVTPHGFCPGYQMCGGHILLDGFSLDKIKRKLLSQGYESNTYASRILKDNQNKIQVVFTEKEFTGKSLEEVQSFYDLLLKDEFFGTKEPELFSSGSYYEKDLLLKFTLSTIFGTLFGALFIFGLLFYIYGSKGQLSLVGLRNRLVSARPLSIHVFAKYDNLEDQARIFDGQSMAGSVVSLNKTTDRHQYVHKDSPSTSTASLDTIVSKDDVVRKEKMAGHNKEFSEIELSDRKEASIETVDDELLLKEL